MIATAPSTTAIGLRTPDEVMRLARIGSFHQTRLSFMRVLLRRIAREGWTFARTAFDIDAKGVGHAVYALTRGPRTYSLVCFSHDLAPEKRTDRVIAEEWDATYALFDGHPTAADIQRLAANVPKQEAGRCLPTELVLARSNKSVRLFEAVVRELAAGRQPDAHEIEATGYLMRTTAVYGNGKFGLADRAMYDSREEIAGPFQAEMMTVWLIRAFTVDLAEHLARLRAPNTAVRLDPALRRRFGIGNATGLGMAPFLVRHPTLIHRWILAREEALRRVRNEPAATSQEIAKFRHVVDRARAQLAGWTTDDPVQAPRIPVLASDLENLAKHAARPAAFTESQPWDALYRWGAENLSLEGQEMLVTLLIEPHGSLVDDLADEMAIDETTRFRISGYLSCATMRALIRRVYGWIDTFDFTSQRDTARFWYVSEEKLEPRLGERALEPGAELEQPLAIARDVAALFEALEGGSSRQGLAGFLLAHPEHRHAARRVIQIVRAPYGEIRDNLIGAELRAIDLLRCKLSFFGCTRFDPRSDKWLRITMYQGAPFPDEIGQGDWDGWIWGPGPVPS